MEYSSHFDAPVVVGRIQSREISESSGLAVSRCQTGVFWTHNDSGNGAFIFAFDLKGKRLGTWRVSGAKNSDWEDIATVKDKSGECFLYIGDIGNNLGRRNDFTIYKVKEPGITERDSSTNTGRPSTSEPAFALDFQFEAVAPNAESLLVHPDTLEIYVLSKNSDGSSSGIYKIASSGENRIARKLGELGAGAFPTGLITSAEISADGRRIILCDYFNAYELSLPADEKHFDEIWARQPSIIKLGERNQGEAIAYSPDMNSIFATSERLYSPLIEVKRKTN